MFTIVTQFIKIQKIIANQDNSIKGVKVYIFNFAIQISKNYFF